MVRQAVARRQAGLRGPRPSRAPAGLAGRRFLAFAGIGDPDKFFDTRRARPAARSSSAAPFRTIIAIGEDELDELRRRPRRGGLALITTAKDAARLRHGSAAARAMLESAVILEIDTLFEPEDLPDRLIAQTLRAFEARRAG